MMIIELDSYAADVMHGLGMEYWTKMEHPIYLIPIVFQLFLLLYNWMASYYYCWSMDYRVALVVWSRRSMGGTPSYTYRLNKSGRNFDCVRFSFVINQSRLF